MTLGNSTPRLRDGRLSWVDTPLMRLEGAHQGEIYCARFRITPEYYPQTTANKDLPDHGPLLLTAGRDHSIVLWDCHAAIPTLCAYRGHTAPILHLDWSSDGVCFVAASADHTLSLWDVEYGRKIRRLRGHSAAVNACATTGRIKPEVFNDSMLDVGPQIIASVSDDTTIKLWDPRSRKATTTIRPSRGPLTCASFNSTGTAIFAAGIDNSIRCWDLKNIRTTSFEMIGHLDTVTGISLSPNGEVLASTAMDSTVRTWDVSHTGKLKDRDTDPLATRMTSIFHGAPHGMEKTLIRPCWSPDGDFIACGSGDSTVVIWDYVAEKPVYKLPGHKGTVNQVDWIGNLLVSCSSDSTILVGEIDLDEVR